MLDVIEHPSGLILSAKTFRPLFIFPWTCSIWRQAPFRTGISTVAFINKAAAKTGHREIVQILRQLNIKPDMSNVFTAIEDYAKENSNDGVKSYRIYSGHAVEGKISLKVEAPRSDEPT